MEAKFSSSGVEVRVEARFGGHLDDEKFVQPWVLGWRKRSRVRILNNEEQIVDRVVMQGSVQARHGGTDLKILGF